MTQVAGETFEALIDSNSTDNLDKMRTEVCEDFNAITNCTAATGYRRFWRCRNVYASWQNMESFSDPELLGYQLEALDMYCDVSYDISKMTQCYNETIEKRNCSSSCDRTKFALRDIDNVTQNCFRNVDKLSRSLAILHSIDSGDRNCTNDLMMMSLADLPADCSTKSENASTTSTPPTTTTSQSVSSTSATIPVSTTTRFTPRCRVSPMGMFCNFKLVSVNWPATIKAFQETGNFTQELLEDTCGPIEDAQECSSRTGNADFWNCYTDEDLSNMLRTSGIRGISAGDFRRMMDALSSSCQQLATTTTVAITTMTSESSSPFQPDCVMNSNAIAQCMPLLMSIDWGGAIAWFNDFNSPNPALQQAAIARQSSVMRESCPKVDRVTECVAMYRTRRRFWNCMGDGMILSYMQQMTMFSGIDPKAFGSPSNVRELLDSFYDHCQSAGAITPGTPVCELEPQYRNCLSLYSNMNASEIFQVASEAENVPDVAKWDEEKRNSFKTKLDETCEKYNKASICFNRFGSRTWWSPDCLDDYNIQRPLTTLLAINSGLVQEGEVLNPINFRIRMDAIEAVCTMNFTGVHTCLQEAFKEEEASRWSRQIMEADSIVSEGCYKYNCEASKMYAKMLVEVVNSTCATDDGDSQVQSTITLANYILNSRKNCKDNWNWQNETLKEEYDLVKSLVKKEENTGECEAQASTNKSGSEMLTFNFFVSIVFIATLNIL